jgi:hypothetical protein
MQLTSFPSGQPIFLGKAHWLDIAIALSDRSLTLAECARRLGVDNASIHRPLREMTREGVLLADPPSLGRGAVYRLREDLISRAEEEASRGQQPGVLIPAQLVFLVKCKQLLGLANALVESDLTRSLIWIAELDAGDEFLLVLDGQHTAPTGPARLRAAIERAGGECSSSRVQRVLNPRSWRRHLAAIRDAGI